MFMALLMVAANGGCAIMDTGPKVAEAAIASGQAIAMEAFKDLKASKGQAGMEANVNDPRYFMRILTGPVYEVYVEVGLIGADLSANILTTLEADENITPEDTALAMQILTQPDVSRERRDAILLELTNRGIEFWEKLLGLGGDDRTTTSTSTTTNEGGGG